MAQPDRTWATATGLARHRISGVSSHALNALVPAPRAEDPHAPLASRDPRTRGAGAVAYDADPIEMACPLCTLERGESGWQHSRSCPFAVRKRRAVR